MTEQTHIGQPCLQFLPWGGEGRTPGKHFSCVHSTGHELRAANPKIPVVLKTEVLDKTNSNHHTTWHFDTESTEMVITLKRSTTRVNGVHPQRMEVLKLILWRRDEKRNQLANVSTKSKITLTNITIMHWKQQGFAELEQYLHQNNISI